MFGLYDMTSTLILELCKLPGHTSLQGNLVQKRNYLIDKLGDSFNKSWDVGFIQEKKQKDLSLRARNVISKAKITTLP